MTLKLILRLYDHGIYNHGITNIKQKKIIIIKLI